MTLCVRFLVRLTQTKLNPGPLLGRVEIHGHAAGALSRLFDLVPGFLVDLADGEDQSFEFRGEVLGAALAPHPRARVATLRLSGRSMPDPARPVWFTLGSHQGLDDVSCEGLQAVVSLRAICCGSRWAGRSDLVLVPEATHTRQSRATAVSRSCFASGTHGRR